MGEEGLISSPFGVVLSDASSCRNPPLVPMETSSKMSPNASLEGEEKSKCCQHYLYFTLPDLCMRK